MTLPLDFIEKQTQDDVSATVILLHGLGASGHDFATVPDFLQLPADLGVRFIFPHAPNEKVTINGFMEMPAWYDIYGFSPDSPQDREGIEHSSQWIRQMIEWEMSKGMPSERIVLAGFSQGGAIALHTAIHYDMPLAGVLALSTYVPLHQDLGVQHQPVQRDRRFFMAHGTQDPVIPIEHARTSKSLLEQYYQHIIYREYTMAHEVCPQQIMDIRQVLIDWLRPSNS